MNEFVIFLFPIFFMIHEFEEIIMIEKWVAKNRSEITARLPKISSIVGNMLAIDTRRFSIIVAEEFFIVSVATVISAYFGNWILWYACLGAFGIHLTGHLLQFIIWRKYMPAIVTTFLCLSYCVWAVCEAFNVFSLKELFLYVIVGFVVCGINLSVMHKIVAVK